MVRIAILGAGWMGSRHAAAFARLEEVEIAAVVGRRPERAGAVAARHGVPALTDLRRVLDDPSVDAVDLTVPTALHRRFAAAAFEAGKHVFCETPLAPNGPDAEAMGRGARAHGRVLQVALLTRFARPSVRAREIVLSGRLGEPRAVTTSRLAPGTSGAHHGDAIEELLLFDLDLLCWTLGMPSDARAEVATDNTGRIQHVFATLRFPRARACAEASFWMPRASYPFTVRSRIVCEGGTVETAFTAPPPRSEVAVYVSGAPPEVDRDTGEDPVVAECRHFVDVLRGEADPTLLDAEQAGNALRVADALRASLETGAAAQP